MPAEIREKLELSSIEHNRLLYCTLEFTPNCNFACKMCGYSMSNEQCKQVNYELITYEDWIWIIDDLEKAGVLYIILTGGEPLQYPYFEQLYLRLAQKGFIIVLKTNAYLVKKYESMFTQYPPYQVYISIYGWSSQTYEAVTGAKNGYNSVLYAIEYFTSINVLVHITYVALKNNYFDKSKCYGYLNQFYPGIKKHYITDIYPHVVNSSFSKAVEYRLNPEERVAWEKTEPFNEEGYRKTVEQLKQLRKLVTIEDLFHPGPGKRMVKHCLDSQNSCFIGSDGKMRFCTMSRFCHAEPVVNGVLQAWQHIRQLEDNIYLEPEKCVRCRIKKYCVLSCPARCAVEGNVSTPPEYVCEYAIMRWLYETNLHNKKDNETR